MMEVLGYVQYDFDDLFEGLWCYMELVLSNG